MIERALFEYLVNALWQLPLLLFGAWLLIRSARPSLFFQHVLWLATLTVAVVLPMRGVVFLDDAPHAQPAAEMVTPPAFDARPLPVSNPASDFRASSAVPNDLLTAPPSRSYLPIHTGRIAIGQRTIRWIVCLYLIFLALSLMRLLISCIAAIRIRAGSGRCAATKLELNLLITCAQRVGLPATRIPEIRSLASLHSSPMVIGIRRPALLLPESLRHSNDGVFDEHQLIAILAHELAHVRRRDYLVNLLARVVSLPVGWHPAVIAMHDRVRQTREMICDADAASVFTNSMAYAHSLLSLAETITQLHSNVEAVGLFDRNRNTLEERIMKLTEPQIQISVVGRFVRIAAGTIILVAATTTAATLHLKLITPAVHAAQAIAPPAAIPQAATPAAGQSVPPPESITVQTPTPAPAPTPDPKARHKVPEDGRGREMTPEERQKFDRQMDEMRAQIEAATSQIDIARQQIDTAKLQKIITDARQAAIKALDSEQFKKQIADMNESLKQLKTPEFRAQVDHLNSPEFKKQMENLKLKLDLGELKMDLPIYVGRTDGQRAADLEYRQRLADARATLRMQIKQAGSDPEKIQKVVDEYVKEVDAATQAHINVPPQPPSPPPPPSSQY